MNQRRSAEQVQKDARLIYAAISQYVPDPQLVMVEEALMRLLAAARKSVALQEHEQ